jgi:hypothetical protein
MKIRTLKNKALSMCLVVAIVATYSMVALAGDKKIVGEILVSGSNETSIVTVNGEAVQSGRTIFTSSTITTADNSAIVNVNKVGKIKIAPKSSILVSFNENGISGNLLNGKVTVLNSTDKVSITVPNGATEQLTVGESATAAKQDDDDDNDGGAAWWLWAAVFGGAAAVIVLAATTDNNRVDLGGGAVTVSPSS